MTNPITQLKQHKGKTTATNHTQNAPKAQSKAITPPTGKNAQNANKGVLSVGAYYPQMVRQFNLMKASVERCKRDYPDCWHFKTLTRKECLSLADQLSSGLVLLQEIHRTAPLTAEQSATLKQFKRGAVFLMKQLSQVAEHIEQVEQGTNTACYDLPQHKGQDSESTHSEM